MFTHNILNRPAFSCYSNSEGLLTLNSSHTTYLNRPAFSCSSNSEGLLTLNNNLDLGVYPQWYPHGPSFPSSTMEMVKDQSGENTTIPFLRLLSDKPFPSNSHVSEPLHQGPPPPHPPFKDCLSQTFPYKYPCQLAPSQIKDRFIINFSLQIYIHVRVPLHQGIPISKDSFFFYKPFPTNIHVSEPFIKDHPSSNTALS